jgi:hypothetical protein
VYITPNGNVNVYIADLEECVGAATRNFPQEGDWVFATITGQEERRWSRAAQDALRLD